MTNCTVPPGPAAPPTRQPDPKWSQNEDSALCGTLSLMNWTVNLNTAYTNTHTNTGTYAVRGAGDVGQGEKEGG